MVVLLFNEGTYNMLNGDKFVSQVMRFVVRFVNEKIYDDVLK